MPAKPGKLGPWGRIEGFEIPFANPNGVYPDSEERRQKPKWFFEHATEQSVERFIASCDLPRVHKRHLLDKSNWNVSSNGCTITPPDQLLWFLTPKAGSRFIPFWGNGRANYPQALPFHFTDKGFDLRLQEFRLAASEEADDRAVDLQEVGRVVLQRPEGGGGLA